MYRSESPARPDGWLLAATFILLAVSVLMVFSTTAVPSQEFYGDSTSMVKRHLLHMIAGLAVFFVFSRLNPLLLQRIAVPLLFLTLSLLIVVLIPSVGHSAGGAQRWLTVGPLRMQPGELAKVAIIIYFAAYIDANRARMNLLVPGAIVPLVVISALAGLLLLEPDFGSTAVLTLVVLFQLFTVCRLSHLVGLGVLAATAGSILILTSPYRMRRLLAFLDPFQDASASGYQLIQSLIAVGSGGMSGAGLGAGKQKLFYLPAAHTDFIYAVIAEELGLLGALFVLGVFLLVLARGLLVAKRLAGHPFLSTLAVGCTMLIVLPALLNVGVVVGLLPTKGMVLPLVAYGGTAMMVHLAAMGILLRLSKMDPS
ncbi:MAG: putative lipid II flippase FtsW [Bdellovibrionales bacterium]|nr:putative lipid II flippase FtsW [Bdellovibrionales bacterium]